MTPCNEFPGKRRRLDKHRCFGAPVDRPPHCDGPDACGRPGVRSTVARCSAHIGGKSSQDGHPQLAVVAERFDVSRSDRNRPFGGGPLAATLVALDSLTPNSAPRLASWVVRTTEIAAVANRCVSIVGNVEPMTRGSLSWQITIPSDGRQPMDGAVPALIEWEAQTHPAQSLPLSGCRLLNLTVVHSDPPSVRTALDLIGFNPSGQVTLSRTSFAERSVLPIGYCHSGLKDPLD